MSQEPLDTFQAECQERLEELELGLLALEQDPQDMETINGLFRAAHTIKGTAGVFGFERLSAFTHEVESVLEQVRQSRLYPERGLVALLLSCRDQIQSLVEEAVEDRDPDPEAVTVRSELAKRLGDYRSDDGPDVAEMAEVEHFRMPVCAQGTVDGEGVEYVTADNWHISVRFGPDLLRCGFDPLAFLRYMRKLGDIVAVTPVFDSLPSLADMDPEQCYLGVEIDFASDAEKSEIEAVFEFIEDDCDLHILPPRARIATYAEVIEALPEDAMQLGEILVNSGALTASELERVLACQERLRAGSDAGEEASRLGQVAVDEKLVHPEVVDAALNKQGRSKARAGQGRWVRVDAEKLDQLINQVGELVIASASSSVLAQRLGDEALTESMSVTGRMVEEIRDTALKLRMVQIGDTFARFQRVVRDVSSELGKDVRLEIRGGDTELDKTVVEKINDPLMHLVRNALDHGIESGAERAAVGKAPEGRLLLNAYHDSGSIVIEVSDDGKGLDPEKILAKARSRGLVPESHIPGEAETYRLIFEPGFSTAEAVTNLSGRGVGMDVVKKNIEALRGSVDVRSTPGAGATFVIRLPLTLAIIDGFLVGVGESAYVIPLEMVQECIELGEADAATRRDGFVNLRGEVLPYLRLRDTFGGQAPPQARENIVVVKCGSQSAGLVVDRLMGEFQTVIKPLGKLFRELDGVSGATILGSGEVAIILDVPALLKVASTPAGPPMQRQPEQARVH